MRHALGLCLNWKVIAAVAAVAVALVVLAPGWGLALLPLLVLAVCPLSMALMMFTMRGHGAQADSCHSTEAQSVAAKRTELASLRAREAELEAQLAAADAPATSPLAAAAE